MRPLRLDIAGFAAFRDPITVDFTDADYFALTGPTGSGKSTVIDTMTFALYGSAPRWGSAASIQYALAPTANRCTIRLVFDVAGQRYVVAREVRRSGKQITQKNPRLERYLDPAATGDPDTDEPTESLAADVSAVKQQVIELLGLDFDDFCTCVVLPQGDFATFLRASVAERQTILLKLLGARHYETIGRLANRRAADANARIEALQGQLNGYADATEEAELTARDRQQQLAALATMVSTEVAALDDVLTARAATTATIDRLTAQFRLLTTVETPAGVGVLQQALAAADNAYATAAQAEQESRTALQAAEDDLRTGPQRGPLEETLRWHAARTSDAARRPEVVAATAQAATALAAAEQTAEQADRDLGLARTEHEQCRARQEQASAAVSAIEERLTLLATVVVPAGTADLGAATAAARSRWDQAVHRWERAEAAIGPVVSVVDALPEPGTITALQRTIDRQEKVLAQRAELAPRLRQAAAELDAAEKVTTKTRHDLDRALADLEQARTQSAAADLRTHLVVGHACPVCDQTVATVPDTLAAPALDTARAAVTKAEQLYRTLAQTEETQSTGTPFWSRRTTHWPTSSRDWTSRSPTSCRIRWSPAHPRCRLVGSLPSRSLPTPQPTAPQPTERDAIARSSRHCAPRWTRHIARTGPRCRSGGTPSRPVWAPRSPSNRPPRRHNRAGPVCTPSTVNSASSTRRRSPLRVSSRLGRGWPIGLLRNATT